MSLSWVIERAHSEMKISLVKKGILAIMSIRILQEFFLQWMFEQSLS